MEKTVLLGFQPEHVKGTELLKEDLLHEKMKCLLKSFNTPALKKKRIKTALCLIISKGEEKESFCEVKGKKMPFISRVRTECQRGEKEEKLNLRH